MSVLKDHYTNFVKQSFMDIRVIMCVLILYEDILLTKILKTSKIFYFPIFLLSYVSPELAVPFCFY